MAGEKIQLGKSEGTVKIWNASGQILFQGKTGSDGSLRMPENLPSGLYQIVKEQQGQITLFRIQIWN
jgi:hypothetical protein